MKGIYSLAEIEAMKQATLNAIGEAMAQAIRAKGAPMTAQELADAIGLCNKWNIINRTINEYVTIGNITFRVRPHIHTEIRHCAELDKNGTIIRYFDMTKQYTVRYYEVV